MQSQKLTNSGKRRSMAASCGNCQTLS